MKHTIEALERKLEQIGKDYQSHLDSIQRMVTDPDNVKSITFEHNMIMHLIEMNSLKSRANEIAAQLISIKIELGN